MRYALAGLQTGVTGALALLVWSALFSVLARRSIWWIPNLVASAHYGQSSVRYGVGVYTAVGLAAILFFYGVVGILFGVAVRGAAASFRLLFAGLGVSLAVYWALESWFWRGMNPVGNLYVPAAPLLFGHLIFGCFLARYPATLRRG